MMIEDSKKDNTKSKKLKKIKIFVDKWTAFCYSSFCVSDDTVKAGCGSAWLERLIWDQEVAGSNPVTPTYNLISCSCIRGCSSMVEH